MAGVTASKSAKPLAAAILPRILGYGISEAIRKLTSSANPRTSAGDESATK